MADVVKGREHKTVQISELEKYRETVLEREHAAIKLADLKMGWIRDLPDFRDYTPEHAEVKPLLQKLKVPSGNGKPVGGPLPKSVDLRALFSPIENQLQIGSCTAQAGVGLLEYYEKQANGKYLNGSRMFLYYVSRRLGDLHGDSGAYLRLTMGGMVLFGVPPETYWPYDVNLLNTDPDQFVYSLAQNFQTLKYFRYDPPGTVYDEAFLTVLKGALCAKLPMMLGFTVYSDAWEQANVNGGKFPFPSPHDKVAGGHAICFAGYDDDLMITNSTSGHTSTGAFIIRNSWGTGRGDHGYGYLPYEYVIKGLTDDYWSMMTAEWVDSGVFGC